MDKDSDNEIQKNSPNTTITENVLPVNMGEHINTETIMLSTPLKFPDINVNTTKDY